MRQTGVLVLVVIVLTSAAAMEAATSSRLEGRVVDDQAEPLAGVQITISSPSLIGGPQSTVTNDMGSFAFHFLLVGEYTVDAELVGYTPATAIATVRLDRTATMTIRMVPVAFSSEIEVAADVPILDPTRTTTGENFQEQYVRLSAIGSENRDYVMIMNQAAGVVPDQFPWVYGATWSDNAYLVDGFNSTDPSDGINYPRFAFDAIEEASALTGGMSAEFGFGTGGVLNVVTKSGGNSFHGTFDARYLDQRFFESSDEDESDEEDFFNNVLAATLGGPILGDRLWFFAAVEHHVLEDTPWGAPRSTVRTENSFLGKITWAINSANRLTLRYSTTPATVDYDGISEIRPPDASWHLEDKEPTGVLELNSVLSDRLLLTVALGFSRRERSRVGMVNDLDTHPEIDFGANIGFSNPWWVEIGDRDRDHHRAKLSYFAEDALGPHQVDAGLEYHRLWESTANFTPGGYLLGYYNNAYMNNPWPDGDGDGLIDYRLWRDDPAWTYGDPRQGEAEGWSAFVNDRWRPTPQLTLNFGLRYDTMAHTNHVGEKIADFDKWLPRLGVAWDVGGRGRHVLRASWGRYMHPGVTNLAMMVPGFRFSTENYLGLDYLCGRYEICDRETAADLVGPEFVHVDSDGDEHPFYLDWITSSVPAETVDTLGLGTLEVPYRDELILAYQLRVAHETSLELQYVKKLTHDMIEDTCNNNTWAWGDGDPPSLDDPSTWTDEDPKKGCTGSVRANMNGLKGDYEALILRAASRARPWFHLVGSYTYSKYLTNTNSQPFSGFGSGLGGFPGGAFDYYPTNFVNRDADMGDAWHMVKLNGYFLLPLDFTLGVEGILTSGAGAGIWANCERMLYPDDSWLAELERLGIDYDEMVQYCQSEYSGSILLDTRTHPRSTEWRLNLQLSKGGRIGGVRLVGIISVFDVIPHETTWYTTDIDELGLYGTSESERSLRSYEIGFRVEF